MNTPLPARKLPADDYGFLKLRGALEWEATGKPPYKSLSICATLQFILIFCPLLPFNFGESADETPPVKRESVVPLFMPVTSVQQKPNPMIQPSPELIVRQIPEPQSSAPSELAIDLSSLELSFADDISGFLPEVVRKYGGELALLDLQDKTIARYLMKPPYWEAQECVRDVSRRFRLIMEPSRKWEVFRMIAEKSGVDLAQYQASALFDAVFRRCLQSAIRDRALSGPRQTEIHVTSARLAFAPNQPCGVEVLEVTLAPNN